MGLKRGLCYCNMMKEVRVMCENCQWLQLYFDLTKFKICKKKTPKEHLEKVPPKKAADHEK